MFVASFSDHVDSAIPTRRAIGDNAGSLPSNADAGNSVETPILAGSAHSSESEPLIS